MLRSNACASTDARPVEPLGPGHRAATLASPCHRAVPASCGPDGFDICQLSAENRLSTTPASSVKRQRSPLARGTLCPAAGTALRSGDR